MNFLNFVELKMGGAAVQASSQSFIASPENSGNVPNNPSNPVNSNETVKKNLRTKPKPLYRELSDYPNDPVTIEYVEVIND